MLGGSDAHLVAATSFKNFQDISGNPGKMYQRKL